MFLSSFFWLRSRLSTLAEILVLLTTNAFMVPSITGSMAPCRGRGWGTLESHGHWLTCSAPHSPLHPLISLHGKGKVENRVSTSAPLLMKH